MVVTLGQQYNVGEKPTVMVYIYIKVPPCKATKHNKTEDTVVYS